MDFKFKSYGTLFNKFLMSPLMLSAIIDLIQSTLGPLEQQAKTRPAILVPRGCNKDLEKSP